MTDRSHVRVAVPDGYRDALIRARLLVREIIPGGRDPEPSYQAKHDALRMLDQLITHR